MAYDSLHAECMETKHDDHMHRFGTPILVALLFKLLKWNKNDTQVVWGL